MGQYAGADFFDISLVVRPARPSAEVPSLTTWPRDARTGRLQRPSLHHSAGCQLGRVHRALVCGRPADRLPCRASDGAPALPSLFAFLRPRKWLTLPMTGPTQDFNDAGVAQGCASACIALGGDANCCSGSAATPETCLAAGVAHRDFFKGKCAQAYSFAYDDATSTFTCGSDGAAAGGYKGASRACFSLAHSRGAQEDADRPCSARQLSSAPRSERPFPLLARLRIYRSLRPEPSPVLSTASLRSMSVPASACRVGDNMVIRVGRPIGVVSESREVRRESGRGRWARRTGGYGRVLRDDAVVAVDDERAVVAPKLRWLGVVPD